MIRLISSRALGLAAALLTLAGSAQAQKTYATDLGGTIYELDFDAATATPLWGTSLGFPFGIAPTDDPNILYVSGFQTGLYEVDMAAQTTTFLGATTPNMATIALNEDDGQYYGSNWSTLHSVDPTGPNVTVVGDFGLIAMYGLDYHRGLGVLLACQTFTSSLYSIDVATGVATVIGPHGTNQVSGMWFDEATGRTFGVTDLNSNGQMLEFDVTTGNATVLATTGINFVGIGGLIEPPDVITPYCFGNALACPCGNPGGAGEGCANSSGAGAIASWQGSASIASDDLVLEGSQLLPNQPALAFVGEDQINNGNGVTFGDGLRCAGTQVKRLGVQVPDANGDASWGPGLAAGQGWSAGDTRYFQIWYRNPIGSPCGADFNLSNGLEVEFRM